MTMLIILLMNGNRQRKSNLRKKHGATKIDEKVNYDFDENWHTFEIRRYNEILNVYILNN